MSQDTLLGLMQVGVLLLLAVTALAVVRTRQTTSQALAICFYGLLLALIFVLYQAPDVALSQLAVGAVALPLMILLSLARIRHDQNERRERARREQGPPPGEPRA
ncbi:MAG TPA: DUF4040 domain-containing protein [Longimicrobiales bacterium]